MKPKIKPSGVQRNAQISDAIAKPLVLDGCGYP